MHKVLVIALREYRAAVRTKAFLISLVMLPVLMGGSLGVQMLVMKADSVKDKRYAVIDRTPGQKLFDALEQEANKRNQLVQNADPESKKKLPKGEYLLERVVPSADEADAINRQRLDLSEKVENGEYQGFVEIGRDVFENRRATIKPGEDPPDDQSIRFQSNKPQTIAEFFPWVEKIIDNAVARRRLADSGIVPEQAQAAQQPVWLKAKGLTHINPRTGEIEETSDERQIANMVAPAILIALMLLMIMIGASPAMQSVLEEKMQRIAEVLLGSVRPFDLMLGKLIGMVGVSLTVAVVYLTGTYVVAYQYGFTDFLSPYLLGWFLVFLVLAELMYGSLFIAIGAAANDMRETQSLLLPVMLVAILPVMLLGPVMMDSNGTLATSLSFIPTATPMLMIARIAVPPGAPWWQPLLGVLGVLTATLGCVWAAGRVFRVGILMSGKGARFGDLIKWVVRG
jgi:ABC-2 type transport system permease protein